VINSAPKILLLLIAIPRLFVILRRPAYTVPREALYFAKVSIPIVLAALWAVDLALVHQREPTSRHQLTAASISVGTYLFAGWLHHLEQLRSAVGSTALLLFWLFQIIADVIVLRTQALIAMEGNSSGEDRWRVVLTATTVILSAIVFALENLPRNHHLYKLVPSGDVSEDDATAVGESEKPQDSPEAYANIFSRISFHWMDPLIKLGYKKDLGMEDLWALSKENSSSYVSAGFMSNWNAEMHKSHPSFLWALAKTFGAAFLSAGLFKVTQDLLAFLQPNLMKRIMEFTLSWSPENKGYEQPIARGAAIACLMLLAALFQTVFLHQYFHISISTGMKTLGPSIFAGVAVMMLAVPVNAAIAVRSRALNKVQMGNKDSRTKLMDEVLSGIKIIKLYAWERPFLKKVNNIRDKELGTLKKMGYLSAVSTYALCKFDATVQTADTVQVFVSLALFNLLQFPLTVFPNVISSLIEATVSIKRIKDFLLNEEMDSSSVKRESGALMAALPLDGRPIERLVMRNGTFSWSNSASSPTLTDVSLTVTDNQLTGVVGTVGAGKSSLLSAFLGEMYKSTGEVTVRGSIAYVAQTPWIMNASLRENILFGKSYDEDFYNRTIDACGLRPDLDILPGGDLTEIGERGINLSGGQKQRISLARAVYARTDIYLLDDSLSAVDAHVGRHIFDNVIGPHGLLKNKARLFVTHSIQHLREFDFIMLLGDGKVVECGPCKELLKKGETGAVYNLVRDYGKRKEESSTDLPASEVAVVPKQQSEEDIKDGKKVTATQ
ncbi:Multidrug resistance-associated protein 1, partial [Cladochytrium tenue]